jgi:hypothetical protein
MAPPTEADNKQRARAQRRARLAAELRSNLKKRKEQARGRALCDAPGAAEANPGEETGRKTGSTRGRPRMPT